MASVARRRAVTAVWGDLPTSVQQDLFESAVQLSGSGTREQLAVFLHHRHPKRPLAKSRPERYRGRIAWAGNAFPGTRLLARLGCRFQSCLDPPRHCSRSRQTLLSSPGVHGSNYGLANAACNHRVAPSSGPTRLFLLGFLSHSCKPLLTWQHFVTSRVWPHWVSRVGQH